MSKVFKETSNYEIFSEEIKKQEPNEEKLLELAKKCTKEDLKPIKEDDGKYRSIFSYCYESRLFSKGKTIIEIQNENENENPIIRPFVSNILDIIEVLLKKGDIENREYVFLENGYNVFILVCFAGDIDLLKLLLKYNVRGINDFNRDNPFDYSIKTDKREMIKSFLENENIKLDQLHSTRSNIYKINYISPLRVACAYNNTFAIKLLLLHPEIEVLDCIDSFTMYEYNVFTVACFNESYDSIVLLLEYMKNLEINPVDYNPSLPILEIAFAMAFEQGSIKIMKALLEYEGPYSLQHIYLDSNILDKMEDKEEVEKMITEFEKRKSISRITGKRKLENNLNNKNDN